MPNTKERGSSARPSLAMHAPPVSNPPSTPAATLAAAADATLRTLVQLQATLLSQADLLRSASAFVGELATKMQFDRVGLAVVQGDALRVLVISDGSHTDTSTAQLERISAAMAEALDQRTSLLVPESRSHAHPRITLAHRRLIELHGGAVATVPVVAHGVAIGVLCAERRGDAAIAPAELEALEQLTSLAGPVLELMRFNELPLRKLAVMRLRERLQPPRRRWAIAGGAALLAGLTLVQTDVHVGGRARVEGAVQRVLVAPADGFLKSVHARPGDTVRAGQPLIELADQDLRLEKLRWESQLAQYESAFGAANARADRAQWVINQSRIAEAQAQLELVDMKLERGRIDAPFDGLVVRGDLSQSLGAPVQQGAELMTVAPRDEFRIIVDVDERDVAALRVGQQGSVTLSALPWQSLAVRVKRIAPIAVVAEGRNVFEVEAELPARSADLRPGLQGNARIHHGSRPLLLAWSDRLVDAMRIKVWEWFG